MKLEELEKHRSTWEKMMEMRDRKALQLEISDGDLRLCSLDVNGEQRRKLRNNGEQPRVEIAKLCAEGRKAEKLRKNMRNLG